MEMVYKIMDIIPLSTELITEDKLTKRELTLNKVGATKEAAYSKVVDMLGATSMTVDKFGDEHISPDNTAQLKASELILRLHGELKNDVVVDNRSVTVSMSGVTPDMVRGMIDMIKSVDFKLISLKDSGSQTGEIIDVEHHVG